MRILVQRVSWAAVSVDGEVVGAIRPDGQGLLAFVGVTHSDDRDKARRLAEKLWNLRILADERSAADVNAPILVVSQFTLYADTAKGRRPSWNAAAPGGPSRRRRRAVGGGIRGGVAGAGRPRAIRRVRREHAGRIGKRRPGYGVSRDVTLPPQVLWLCHEYDT